jgi:1-deoxy-D-xylulose-5-phosphate synthase
MAANNYKASVKILGIPDKIIEQGSPKELYNEIGIDANHIADVIREMDKIEIEKLIIG